MINNWYSGWVCMWRASDWQYFFCSWRLRKNQWFTFLHAKSLSVYALFTLFFTFVYKTATIHVTWALIFRWVKKMTLACAIFAVARRPLLVIMHFQIFKWSSNFLITSTSCRSWIGCCYHLTYLATRTCPEDASLPWLAWESSPSLPSCFVDTGIGGTCVHIVAMHRESLLTGAIPNGYNQLVERRRIAGYP